MPIRIAVLAAALIVAPAMAASAVDAPTVVDPEAYYPEGPLALADGSFLYTEMGRDRVVKWDGRTKALVWSRSGCGPTGIARSPDGGIVVLCHFIDAIARVAPGGDTLALIGADATGRKFTNPNATANDGKGGVYFSSSGLFAPGAPATGAILYLDPKGVLHRVADDIHYANGVAVSRDGTRLYVSEHLSRRVLVFRIGEDGSLSDRQTFVALDDLLGVDPARSWEVGPDGLATDSVGNLYIAEYGGGHYLIVDPAGKLITIVEVPERYTTGVALSPDESHLFLTAPAALAPSVPGKVYVVANPVHARD